MEEDYELTLFDRANAIRDVIAKYGEDRFYLSFSGGKDSTVLHYLIDYALPGNSIPRVYIDTGIEYEDVRKFVMGLAEKDPRFTIIRPSKPIRKVLETYGYPFKSKEHSLRVEQFNKGTNANYIRKYITGYEKDGRPSHFVCPKVLLYQFAERGKYNYSNLCCHKLKKEAVRAWEKENGRSIPITGMRSEEGGNRRRLGCVISDGKGGIRKFHPLIKASEAFEEWFAERERVSNFADYIIPLSISEGRDARDARSPSTFRGSWTPWSATFRAKGRSARPYGSTCTTNTVALATG